MPSRPDPQMLPSHHHRGSQVPRTQLPSASLSLQTAGARSHKPKPSRLPLPLGHRRWGCSVAQSCLTLWDPKAAACRASLSFTISQSLLKLMSLSWWCHPTISSSVVPFSSRGGDEEANEGEVSCPRKSQIWDLTSELEFSTHMAVILKGHSD